METFGIIFGYLAISFLCYYAIYANAVDFNFRLELPYKENESAWQEFVAFNKGVLDLLVLDFLKIHCPFNWETAVRYRVREAHRLLRGMTHEKGWTTEDCHNPANHEQIAKDCFQSRTRFWTCGIFAILTSPIRLFLFIIVVLVLSIIILPSVSVFSWLKSKI